MKLYNSFIVVLALAFTAITVVLAAAGVDKLDTYFSLYTLALLAMAMLYAYFSPKARRSLTMVGLVAFAGFMVIVLLKAGEALSSR